MFLIMLCMFIWIFCNLIQSVFWGHSPSEWKTPALEGQSASAAPHKGPLRESRVSTLYSSHTHTHTRARKVMLQHFLRTYVLVNVISEGHINMHAVGLFVYHGKQHVFQLHLLSLLQLTRENINRLLEAVTLVVSLWLQYLRLWCQCRDFFSYDWEQQKTKLCFKLSTRNFIHLF